MIRIRNVCYWLAFFFVVTGENVDLAFSLVAKQIYAMLQDGRLTLSDGWDGIKKGYGSELPVDNFQIREDSHRRNGGCCS